MSNSKETSCSLPDPSPSSSPGCDLCGLPLRYGKISYAVEGQTLKFCCQGCKMVYAMLLESTNTNDPKTFKETDLYRQCVAAGVIPANEEDLCRLRRQEKEETLFTETTEKLSRDTDTLGLDLKIEGMWCTACAWVIERSAAKLHGVQSANCNFSTDRFRCRYRPDRIAPDQIREAMARLGYRSREADEGTIEQKNRRRDLVRLAITGLLSANVMMLSWALYAGFFTTLSPEAVSKISFPIVAMATAVMIYGGGSMLRKAWFGLVHRMPGMETLVGVAAVSAFLYSFVNWLTGSIHLYFDTACMLITLVLLGKFLEHQAKNRVRRDLDSFFDLQPNKVRLIQGSAGTGRYVSIEQLAIGDVYAVDAGEIVPADGRVESGWASVDESSLTGEPKPVPLAVGDSIKSGTRLISGKVTATAEQVGNNTILGQMIRIMTLSLEQKSAIEAKSDRMLRWFVPIIIGLSVGTGLFCLVAGIPFHESVVRSVTVMVISCPCALGVAIPVARLAGISLAGRQGILVREIEAFERATDIDTLVFDKTGTLTRGRWQLNKVHCENGVDEKTVLRWAAGLERTSDHEIARSIKAYARQNGIRPAKLEQIIEYPDGVEGRLGEKTFRIGNRGFSMEKGNRVGQVGEEVEGTFFSRVFLSIDDRLSATMIFGDAIRPSVPAMVKTFGSDNYSLHLISGDGHAATREVGRTIKIPVSQGNLLPAGKATYIDQLTFNGHKVAMVGDGINDAAAMARANLAVAVYSGSGLAKEVAHITLMRGDPSQLLDFFPLAEKVNCKVVQNLWCAWIYNLISIPVAMSGLLTPLVAATAMLLSSLTVIGNTLLLVRDRSHRTRKDLPR